MNLEDMICTGTNMEGNRCTRHRTPGQEVCWWHQPEKVEQRARALEEQVANVRGNAQAAS